MRRPSCVENFFDRFEYGGAVGTGYSGSVALCDARGHPGNVAVVAALGRSRRTLLAAHAERGRAQRDLPTRDFERR